MLNNHAPPPKVLLQPSPECADATVNTTRLPTIPTWFAGNCKTEKETVGGPGQDCMTIKCLSTKVSHEMWKSAFAFSNKPALSEGLLIQVAAETDDFKKIKTELTRLPVAAEATAAPVTTALKIPFWGNVVSQSLAALCKKEMILPLREVDGKGPPLYIDGTKYARHSPAEA